MRFGEGSFLDGNAARKIPQEKPLEHGEAEQDDAELLRDSEDLPDDERMRRFRRRQVKKGMDLNEEELLVFNKLREEEENKQLGKKLLSETQQAHLRELKKIQIDRDFTPDELILFLDLTGEDKREK